MVAAKSSGTEPLPPLYQRWIDEVLAGPIPAESAATCSSCPMCSASAPAGDATHFNPRTKCCTALPSLANFLVGQVLLDDDPAAAQGRASVVSRIQGGTLGVTPLGLGGTRAYWLVFRALTKIYEERGSNVFGRGDSVVCPHFLSETGSCGIWKHRESTCATWFCTYVRGDVGQHFWSELRTMLSAVEVALARWCLGRLDLGTDAWKALPAPPRDDAPASRASADAEYRAAWGSWTGREEELYAACARMVEPLAWSEVLAIGGDEVVALAGRVRRAHALLLAEDVPDLIHERALVRNGGE